MKIPRDEEFRPPEPQDEGREALAGTLGQDARALPGAGGVARSSVPRERRLKQQRATT